VIARTLARRVVMRTTDREVFEAIRFLHCEPEIVAAPKAETVLVIEPLQGRYRVLEEGQEVDEDVGVRSLVDRLHSRLYTSSLGDRPQAGLLHAASLRRGGRRLLIAGAAAAGKTTLALRLIRSGYDLEGDEHVFLEEDGVIARPRGCRVKEGSLALLPEVAKVMSSLPVYVDHLGRRIFNVDPRTIGGSWRIEKGEVACLIVLRPNHGGRSSLRPLAPLGLAQALMSEMGLREVGRRASIGAIAGFVNRTRGFELSLGDHESAVRCVDHALNEAP
jgi:hypothetical protein